MYISSRLGIYCRYRFAVNCSEHIGVVRWAEAGIYADALGRYDMEHSFQNL